MKSIMKRMGGGKSDARSDASRSDAGSSQEVASGTWLRGYRIRRETSKSARQATAEARAAAAALAAQAGGGSAPGSAPPVGDAIVSPRAIASPRAEQSLGLGELVEDAGAGDTLLARAAPPASDAAQNGTETNHVAASPLVPVNGAVLAENVSLFAPHEISPSGAEKILPSKDGTSASARSVEAGALAHSTKDADSKIQTETLEPQNSGDQQTQTTSVSSAVEASGSGLPVNSEERPVELFSFLDKVNAELSVPSSEVVDLDQSAPQPEQVGLDMSASGTDKVDVDLSRSVSGNVGVDLSSSATGNINADLQSSGTEKLVSVPLSKPTDIDEPTPQRDNEDLVKVASGAEPAVFFGEEIHTLSPAEEAMLTTLPGEHIAVDGEEKELVPDVEGKVAEPCGEQGGEQDGEQQHDTKEKDMARESQTESPHVTVASNTASEFVDDVVKPDTGATFLSLDSLSMALDSGLSKSAGEQSESQAQRQLPGVSQKKATEANCTQTEPDTTKPAEPSQEVVGVADVARDNGQADGVPALAAAENGARDIGDTQRSQDNELPNLLVVMGTASAAATVAEETANSGAPNSSVNVDATRANGKVAIERADEEPRRSFEQTGTPTQSDGIFVQITRRAKSFGTLLTKSESIDPNGTTPGRRGMMGGLLHRDGSSRSDVSGDTNGTDIAENRSKSSRNNSDKDMEAASMGRAASAFTEMKSRTFLITEPRSTSEAAKYPALDQLTPVPLKPAAMGEREVSVKNHITQLPVMVPKPLGRNWSSDLVALLHNGILSEVIDLYSILESMRLRRLDLTVRDVSSFFEWWWVFKRFVLQMMITEEDVIFRFIESRANLPPGLSESVREKQRVNILDQMSNIDEKGDSFLSGMMVYDETELLDESEGVGKAVLNYMNVIDRSVPGFMRRTIEEDAKVTTRLRHEIVHNMMKAPTQESVFMIQRGSNLERQSEWLREHVKPVNRMLLMSRRKKYLQHRAIVKGFTTRQAEYQLQWGHSGLGVSRSNTQNTDSMHERDFISKQTQ
ncbi:hypothetical protein FVE85_4696 [Porphyridium purpureum]|uniref:Uncharacterized protein n=1 Tax=Porphyridium purpureum TaxID=35688 RepID=A0A5J4YQ19_PORPP|nr:hypothetical protein FVE85_4696 [Porphyridium purpureum]|eukprot:POR2742..scf236_6